jgi:hypothetical protein
MYDEMEQAARAKRAREEAERLFPKEEWRELEPRLFLALSREPHSKNQFEVLEKERVQARILTGQGSTVYLLPEPSTPENVGEKHPDAVVDGWIVEFKTVTGNVGAVEKRFKQSRKKAERVFLKIDSDLSRDEVMKKLQGVILQKGYEGGRVLAYFTASERLYFWDIDDLRGNKKSGS